MMAGTTVSGIGSGIDTQAIVKSLVDAQKAPKQTQINTQTLKATTTLSSIGKIQAALDAFRGALTSMTTGNSFGGLSLKSSDEKVATITAGAGAANGSFNLVVTSWRRLPRSPPRCMPVARPAWSTPVPVRPS
jgi:flagellar hook-associated protein 2